MAGLCLTTALLFGIYITVSRFMDHLERRRCAAFHLQRKAAIASWRLDHRQRRHLPYPAKFGGINEESASLTGSLQYSMNYGTEPNLGVIDETEYVSVPTENGEDIPEIAVSV